MSTQNLLSADDSLTDGEINGNPIMTLTSETPSDKPDGDSGDIPPDKPDGDSGDTPPDKPDGDSGDTPPDKPDGDGGGGGTEDTTTLTGVLQLDSGTEIYDGEETGETLSSTTSDENVILAQNGASLTISNYTLNKTGDCSSADNSNFYAVNAVVAAKSTAKIYIDNSVLNSNAEGANGLFASGEGSTIYAYNCTITSTGNSSRGLDATYEGTVIASKLTISTSGDHCAALATDRGDGYISVTDSTLTTAGQGSPLIYSTGIIEVNNVTGTSTGSQIAGIEGLSTIRIKNSNLVGSEKKASEPVANGVIIYQSMSGDSTEGTATFEVADSTLVSTISGGAMFYVTNTSAVITVQNTVLDFDSDSNYLLKAAGNDGSNGWGTAGSNGADVIFTAIDQTLGGTVSVDGISSLDMYLINTDYTGTFEADTTYTGTGGTDLYIDADSTWTVTGDCTLQSLTAAAGTSIVDANGETVSIVSSSGEMLVSGTSDFTVTVSAYTSGVVEALYTVNDFEIDRSAFEEMYDCGSDTTSSTVSDYNGSGKSDMIQFVNGLVYVTHDTDAGYVQTPAINDVTGWNVTEIRRDLTGDGLTDVQITSDAGDGTTWVAVLRNDFLTDGCITLNYQFIGAYDNELWSYLGSADVNGDGKSEVLMIQTDAGADEYGHCNIAAWVTDSDGMWVSNEWVGSLTGEWSVAGTADVTGDGEDNVILRNSDGMIGYWNEAGNNEIIEVWNAGESIMLTSGDFDGDGADDLLFTNADGDFFTWTNIKSGVYAECIGNASDLDSNWTFAGAGDYNGDGMDEILWCDGTNTAYSEADKENFKNLITIA